MFLTGKVALKKKLVEAQKCICVLWNHYSTGAEVNDKNVLKSSDKIVLPDVSLPEIIMPKFEDYSSYTATVRV